MAEKNIAAKFLQKWPLRTDPQQLIGPEHLNAVVVNISNTPLSGTQETLLSHRPNFAVAPKNPPNKEYITAIEIACQS